MSAVNKSVTIDGKTYTLGEASHAFQVPWSTIRQRYYHHDRGRALIRPVKRIQVNVAGKEYTLGELSLHYRLNLGTVKSRYYKGKRGKNLIMPLKKSVPREHRPQKRRLIIFHGERWTFHSLSQQYNIECRTLRGRYYRGDRDGDLVRPIGTNVRQSRAPLHVEINGKTYTFQELSHLYHLPLGTIHDRYYQGKQGNELIRPLKKNFS